MTADEVLPWLFLAMSSIAFLVGIFLLVTGQRAAAAGETHKIAALGITVQSSTPGLAVTGLAIVAVIATIRFGVVPATTDDDTDDSSSDTTTQTTEPTTDHTGNGNNGNSGHTDGPPVSGLTPENVIGTAELELATADLGITGWHLVPKEQRPTLDCQGDTMNHFPGLLKPAAAKNFEASDGLGAEAHAMSTVGRYSSEDAADEAFDKLSGYLDSCPNTVNTARPVSDEPGQPGPIDGIEDRVYARNVLLQPDDTPCTDCVWIESQAVGQRGDLIVLVSIDWHQPSPFDDNRGPITTVMERAMDLADD